MSAPLRRGWCPSLARPMAAGDGLLVRLRPPAARLSHAQVQQIATFAQQWGNGQLELTRRGNLQLRGFNAAGHAALVAQAQDLDSGVPLLCAPLSTADDPTCALDIAAQAQAIAPVLRAHRLPAKFALALDGGGVLSLGTTGGADVRLYVEHGQGWLHPAGTAQRLCCAPAQWPEVLHRWLSAMLDAMSPEVRRVHALWTHLDPAQLLPGPWQTAVPAAHKVPTPGIHRLAHGDALLQLALPFGSFHATQWMQLAELASQYGDGTLRLTPWRQWVLPGVMPQHAPQALAAASALGLITTDTDPRLRIEACPGAPACRQAVRPVRALAQHLAPVLPSSMRLHVSACAKGCACPEPCDLTLTATAQGFDLIENGRADQIPLRSALSEAEVRAYLESRA